MSLSLNDHPQFFQIPVDDILGFCKAKKPPSFQCSGKMEYHQERGRDIELYPQSLIEILCYDEVRI
jgi:hypothetical protein